MRQVSHCKGIRERGCAVRPRLRENEREGTERSENSSDLPLCSVALPGLHFRAEMQGYVTPSLAYVVILWRCRECSVD